MNGSCLCGGVSYRISGPIHGARYCHCANCRKFSGTAYAAWGLVQTDQFHVAADARVTKYDSGGGLRVFCATCGSPLWYEPAGMPQYRGVPLGVIDDPGVPRPGMHLWTRSKAPWVTLDDDLPQHDTHP